MKKSFAVVLMLFALAVTIPPAHAANYFCVGTVTYISSGADGDVVVQVPGSSPQVNLCNLNNSTTNGFTPETCKNGYATLLAAKLAGLQAYIYFSDNLTCSTQPSWSSYVSAYWIAIQ